MVIFANSKMSAEIAGIVSPINFAGMADNQTRVQYLIDLVGAETVDGADLQARQYMDEMSASCRRSLVVALTKCKAAITNT